MPESIRIEFYGHAMFTVESPDDAWILGFDPYNEQVKSKLPNVRANLVLVSHYHFDHANATLFKGEPKIIDSPGTFHSKTAKIEGFQSYHDKSHGLERGKNIIFKVGIGQFFIAHLGDLGEIPDQKVLDALKDLDVLLIPVGGIYTIDENEAFKMIKAIKPKIAIPMHFKEKDTHVGVNDIRRFENLVIDIYPVKKFFRSLELHAEDVPKETEIWIMTSS